MAKNKNRQRATETVAEPAAQDQVELVQTAAVEEEQYHPEDVAAMNQMADSYVDVENVQVKVSDDRQAAMALMRHLDGQHTLLMAARNAAGEWLGVRAILIKAGGDLSDFQKPSSVKPA